MAEEILDGEFYTLTDEDGNESRFELIGQVEMDESTYYALIPEADSEEYVILKLAKDENDEDFDRVADFFEDELFDEIDYDNTPDK